MQNIKPIAPGNKIALSEDKVNSLTPLEIMMLKSIEDRVDIDVLERIILLKEKLDAKEDQKKYIADLINLKAKFKPPKKNKPVYDSYNNLLYYYAPIEAITKALDSAILASGNKFYYNWICIDQTEYTVTMQCQMFHIGGWVERSTFENKIIKTTKLITDDKAIAGAREFAKRKSLSDILGMRFEESDLPSDQEKVNDRKNYYNRPDELKSIEYTTQEKNIIWTRIISADDIEAQWKKTKPQLERDKSAYAEIKAKLKKYIEDRKEKEKEIAENKNRESKQIAPAINAVLLNEAEKKTIQKWMDIAGIDFPMLKNAVHLKAEKLDDVFLKDKEKVFDYISNYPRKKDEVELISIKEIYDIRMWLSDHKVKENEFCGFLGYDALKEIPKSDYEKDLKGNKIMHIIGLIGKEGKEDEKV